MGSSEVVVAFLLFIFFVGRHCVVLHTYVDWMICWVFHRHANP